MCSEWWLPTSYSEVYFPITPTHCFHPSLMKKMCIEHFVGEWTTLLLGSLTSTGSLTGFKSWLCHFPVLWFEQVTQAVKWIKCYPPYVVKRRKRANACKVHSTELHTRLCVCTLSLNRTHLFTIPWTVALQALLSMEFFQARMLEQVAISYSRGSSVPRDWNCIPCVSCIGRKILHHFICATGEALGTRLELDQY